MPEHTLEISGSLVVLVGSFNPAIFHPEWFARNGLLGPRTWDIMSSRRFHRQRSRSSLNSHPVVGVRARCEAEWHDSDLLET